MEIAIEKLVKCLALDLTLCVFVVFKDIHISAHNINMNNNIKKRMPLVQIGLSIN